LRKIALGRVWRGKALTQDENVDSMAGMKAKRLVLTLGVWFAAGALCLAASSQVGAWKLNEPKSKFTPGTGKNTTVVYKDAIGGKVKITTDGIDANGKPAHSEWTGKFDGKDYAVTGDPNSDMRSYKKAKGVGGGVDDLRMDFTVKKSGKVTANGHVVVAADGKSRTVTVSGTDAKGKKFQNTAVYDKH
jgi:hypothetical protein